MSGNITQDLDRNGASETPELPKSLIDQVEFWKATGVKRAETRSNFNQHLAVLCAGSIAVIASAVVALLSYRAAHPGPGWEFPTRTLLMASITLWLALTCWVVQNYLETVIQDRAYDTTIKDITSGLVKLAITMRGQNVTTDPWHNIISQQTKVIDSRAKLSLKFIAIQRWISFGGVIFFLAGYALLISLIWIEAKLL